MVTKSFSIQEAFSYGWAMFRKHAREIIPFCIVFAVVSIVFGALVRSTEIRAPLASNLFNALGTITQLVLMLGLIKITFKLEHGKEVAWADFLSMRHRFFSYFFAFILLILGSGIVFLLPAVGLFAFAITHHQMFLPLLLGAIILIAGLFIITRFKLLAYVIVDTDLKGMAALKKSWELTKHDSLEFFLFVILAVILNIFGAIVFVVGLFVTAPLTLFAMVFVYRKLSAHHKTKHAESHHAEKETTE